MVAVAAELQVRVVAVDSSVVAGVSGITLTALPAVDSLAVALATVLITPNPVQPVPVVTELIKVMLKPVTTCLGWEATPQAMWDKPGAAAVH